MTAALCLMTTSALTGCYTTKVYRSGSASETAVHTDTQWFGLLGLVRYSDPDESKCGPDEELSYVESKYTGYDFLIDLGISAIGAAAAIGIASSADASDEAQIAAANAGAAIGPLFASRRTVKWACRALGPSGQAQRPNQ
ncbi:MAG: hypothetical protein AAFN74_19595 [Myxococcota bacterium]